MVEETSQSKVDTTPNTLLLGWRINKKRYWLYLGIGLLSICAVHCLLVPIFVSLIPLWPALQHDHECIDLVFFFAIAPTVILSWRRFYANK